ncbi:MAG: hypothetical protein HYZ71_06890 [Deltaproteobacteria bacterium]|nr:hypothetical protein [Deltaproteobacteria bacterium]
MFDEIPFFTLCPRCNSEAYDRCPTHAFCVECNYSPDLDYVEPDVPKWALDIVNDARSGIRRGWDKNAVPEVEVLC